VLYVVFIIQLADEGDGLRAGAECPILLDVSELPEKSMSRRLAKRVRMSRLLMSGRLRWMTALALLTSRKLALHGKSQQQE
jgi:hypothetical protein